MICLDDFAEHGDKADGIILTSFLPFYNYRAFKYLSLDDDELLADDGASISGEEKYGKACFVYKMTTAEEDMSFGGRPMAENLNGGRCGATRWL